MPPSAGAWNTIEAELSPDCGRAGLRSSIITAIGWRAAAAGLTSSPVNADGTRIGLGLGLGAGLAGVGLGLPPTVAVGAGLDGEGGLLGTDPEPVGTGVVGEQATSRTARVPTSPRRRIWLPCPITRRRIAEVSNPGLRMPCETRVRWTYASGDEP